MNYYIHNKINNSKYYYTYTYGLQKYTFCFYNNNISQIKCEHASST